jgi:hypothetical protein
MPNMASFGLDDDPFINAVHRGIKRDIDIAMDNRCFRAVVILTYAGIDAMGYTTLPPGEEEVTRDHFIAWSKRYIRFIGSEQITSEELYAARCAVLHTYGVESKLSRRGACRKVGYYEGINVPPIMSGGASAPDCVWVTVTALRDAFFRGIDDYADEASRNPDRWAQIEVRLHNFLQHSTPGTPP